MALSSTNRNTVAGLLKEASDAIADGMTNPALGDDIAQRAIKNIRATTRAGQDRFGARFTKYADSTRKRKRKKGQRIRPPSLTDTEHMLDDMTERAINRTTVNITNGRPRNEFQIASLGFATRRSEQIAFWHINGTVKMPARDFFGMQEPAQAQLAEYYGIALRRVVPSDRRKRIKIFLFKV